jgi:hypothetical protein
MYTCIYLYIYTCISIYVNDGSDDESTMSDLEEHHQDYGIYIYICPYICTIIIYTIYI